MIEYENNRIFVFKGVMPHVNTSDKYIVLFFIVVLSLLRIIFAGCDSCYTIKYPSVFRSLITKYELSPKKRVAKMSESIWYFIWHTSSCLYTLKLLIKDYGNSKNPGWINYFLKDLKGIWFFAEDIYQVKSKTPSWPELEINMETRILLLMCTGFWISCLIFIRWETRRSDTSIMTFHHITTTTLLILSYIYNFHRISIIIIFLHDIPDVFLYLTKTYSYFTRKNEILLSLFFVTYGLSHFIARFVLLLRYIAYPLLINFDNFEYSGGTIRYLWDFPGGIICPISIIILTIMNAYWLKLILGLFKKFLLDKEELR
ncbi:uncharacterized protein TA12945 [Theileria annulata]|uniref:TLC domain-containing protein n=1 Tax=Theileria annulata TaxID=5874 RepID=Q4UE99_THEAN|nr:uncharacterized protein TA12945 [Theileria annulata]CAI74590.1 hypothetical protein, conserved [Theileria annulata]|eukprot:XP_952322.1 hypothetical protein, conserved [Theileria annulata]